MILYVVGIACKRCLILIVQRMCKHAIVFVGEVKESAERKPDGKISNPDAWCMCRGRTRGSVEEGEAQVSANLPVIHAASICLSSLLVHAQKTGTEPHDKLGPCRVCLELSCVTAGCGRIGVFVRKSSILVRRRTVAMADQILRLLVVGEIRSRTLRSSSLAGRRVSVMAFNLLSLLDLILLHCLDMFLCCLLVLCLLLLLEFAACFLDCLGAGTGVDLRSTADAKALVNGGSYGG